MTRMKSKRKKVEADKCPVTVNFTAKEMARIKLYLDGFELRPSLSEFVRVASRQFLDRAERHK